MSKEKALMYLLRIIGIVALTALFFVFCPTAWLDFCHQRLGLGPLPQGPIVEYLARTESALYAFLGLIFIVMSSDIPRYLPLIRLISMVIIPLSIAVTWLDIKLALPMFWIISEGPGTLLMGIIMLFLTRPKSAKH